MIGPWAVPEAGCIVVAASYKQSRIAFRHVQRFLRPWIEADPDAWRVWDSSQASRIEYRPLGSYVEAREAEPTTLHGEAGRLVLCDEPRKWRSTTASATWSALRGGLGKIEGAKAIALGTRPEGDHWFLQMLDDPGPSTVVVEHRAGADDDPGDPKTWMKANPSLAHNPILMEFYRDEWGEVERDPARMPTWRSDFLNMGVSDTTEALLIQADQWEAIEVDIQPGAARPVRARPGSCRAVRASPLPRRTTGRPGASRRSRASRSCRPCRSVSTADAVRDQLYQRLEAAGELLVMDGGDHGDQVVPVKAVLQECVRRWGRPEVLIADYHAVHELHGVMAAAGLHPNMHKASSLGWQDSPWRVRSFRRAVLAGRVHPPRSLLMRASLTGAKTQRNTGGDEKLVKARGGRGGAIRDDVAVTLMQAISEGFSRAEAHRPRRTRVTRLSA